MVFLLSNGVVWGGELMLFFIYSLRGQEGTTVPNKNEPHINNWRQYRCEPQGS
jgi:hypothetical protein